MTYGEFFISIVAYLISIIIIAEAIYKIAKDINRKQCEECWKTKPLDFTREDAYEISLPITFIISLIIIIVIYITTNWNIEI